MLCNEIPRLTIIDKAIEARIVILSFPYKFVNKQRELLANHEKILDFNLKTKIKENQSYRNGFFWLLVDAWNEKKGKLVEYECTDTKFVRQKD